MSNHGTSAGSHTVILDTDIGTDVDDALALGVCLGSPEIDLVAITTVYGDVLLRARMARKLLALRGVQDLPVLAGEARPLDGSRELYWGGHEGDGLLGPGDESLAPTGTEAVSFLVRRVRERPNTVHLVAIGPLTNVARAIQADARFAGDLAGLTIMGGVLRGPDGLHLPIVEHNLRCDPEAAQVVFASGAPISLVPLDVTTRVAVHAEDVAQLRAAPSPFHHALAELVEHDPRYRAGGRAYLHDPLAVAVLLRPELVGWHDVHVTVELGGAHTAGQSLFRLPSAKRPANARVALSVDAVAAAAFVTGRLIG